MRCLIIGQLRIIITLVHKERKDRQCGPRTLAIGNRPEVSGAVLATYPHTASEHGRITHEPRIRLIVSGSRFSRQWEIQVVRSTTQTLNFGIAKKYNGLCNLRFDDTNPVKEDVEYVDSIKEDITWLGFQWAEEHYASDYFDQLYEWAEKLIMDGLAYVDDQSQEEISAGRGVPTKPGTESPYRNRTVEENLDLFRRMKAGEFPDGSKVLRAKTGMTSPNMHMRDPIMYRILHSHHHRTGDKWCIYPMYDYAHGQSDYIEGITV